MMKYIIMADGKGTRWNNFANKPKHLIEVGNETLLVRLVRQLRLFGAAQIIITAKDARYEVLGAIRYEPKNNYDEIDRFTSELIADHVCFLYGDTYYTDEAIAKIVEAKENGLLFFGDERNIVAVKVFDGVCMRSHIHQVKSTHPNGKGWHIYRSYSGMPLQQIGDGFVNLKGDFHVFNSKSDYLKFLKMRITYLNTLKRFIAKANG